MDIPVFNPLAQSLGITIDPRSLPHEGGPPQRAGVWPCRAYGQIYMFIVKAAIGIVKILHRRA
ncbi:hypothetical protein I656_00962 [Geobacillus sp. WSUCF1]|nr:hypothetical protein I656_00962 [Geobacillus sp. WSUCF1]